MKVICITLLPFLFSLALYAVEKNNNYFRIQLEYLDLAYHIDQPLCQKFNQTYKNKYSVYNQQTFDELSNYVFYQICLNKHRIIEKKECVIEDKISVDENVINMYIHQFKKVINQGPNKNLEALPWFISKWRDLKDFIKGDIDCRKLSKLKPSSLGYYEVLNLMPIPSKNKLISTLNENFQINYKDKFLYEEKALMIKHIWKNQNVIPNLNKKFWKSYIKNCYNLEYSPLCAQTFDNSIDVKSNLISIALIRNIESQIALNLLKKYPSNRLSDVINHKSSEKLKSILQEEIIFIQSSYANISSLIDRYQRLAYLKIEKLEPIKIDGKKYTLNLMETIDECMPNYREYHKIISSKQELIIELESCIKKLNKKIHQYSSKKLDVGSIKVKLVETANNNKNYYTFYLKKRFYKKQGFILYSSNSKLHTIEVPFSIVEVIRFILFTKDEFTGPLLEKHFLKYSDLLY